MPHFSDCSKHSGQDTWICQGCGQIFCSGCVMSEWRIDITGNNSAGNVCPTCIARHAKGIFGKLIEEVKAPMSIHEYCEKESGLTGQALDRYISRYYGLD